jgi:hypothetical protein
MPVSPVARVMRRPGRPRVLSVNQVRKLIQLATSDARHRRVPYDQLAAEAGICASVSILRRAFDREGYHRCVASLDVLVRECCG